MISHLNLYLFCHTWGCFRFVSLASSEKTKNNIQNPQISPNALGLNHWTWRIPMSPSLPYSRLSNDVVYLIPSSHGLKSPVFKLQWLGRFLRIKIMKSVDLDDFAGEKNYVQDPVQKWASNYEVFRLQRLGRFSKISKVVGHQKLCLDVSEFRKHKTKKTENIKMNKKSGELLCQKCVSSRSRERCFFCFPRNWRPTRGCSETLEKGSQPFIDLLNHPLLKNKWHQGLKFQKSTMDL